MKGPYRAEKSIVVFNHNVIKLYFTANKSTMYTTFYDSVHLFALFVSLSNSSLSSNPLEVTN